jgi:DNA-binding response OmpR family regulator
VIEDEDPLRENLVELLELEGFTVTAAATAELGIELARQIEPDLVLCDVGLPGMTGHDVVRAIRAHPLTDGMPFVFLSGQAERTDVRAGMKLGADDYLTKPFAREDLLDVVRSRLARFARQGGSTTPMPVETAHAPTMLLAKTDPSLAKTDPRSDEDEPAIASRRG